MASEIFTPPFYLRSTLAQTMLAGSGMRKWGDNPMLEFRQRSDP